MTCQKNIFVVVQTVHFIPWLHDLLELITALFSNIWMLTVQFDFYTVWKTSVLALVNCAILNLLSTDIWASESNICISLPAWICYDICKNWLQTVSGNSLKNSESYLQKIICYIHPSVAQTIKAIYLRGGLKTQMNWCYAPFIWITGMAMCTVQRLLLLRGRWYNH